MIRQKLIISKISHTFESVMSLKDKIDDLKKAKQYGFKRYLYFISTEDPIINISRVENIVKLKGHSVLREKIVSKYYKSLENLYDAILESERAFIFDNSGDNRVFLAEINYGRVSIKSNTIPQWFKKYFLDKL